MRSALVVEDDEDIRELLGLRLRRMDLSVLSAATGEDALRIARTRLLDLILLDLHLPGIDGWEVLRRLRDEAGAAAVPVLVVSMADASPGGDKARSVDGWLVKPFSGRDVDREVSRLLGDASQR